VSRVKKKLDETELAVLAARMLADYDAVNPGTVFAEGLRLELSEAWRLQTAVTGLREARGEKVIGYKVGAVSAVNQNMMGLPQPVWGRLWETELHGDGAKLKKADYANIAIEAEFGITLSRDIAPEMSIDEIADAVAAVYPLLELHNLTLRGDSPHGHELIANNCIVCGVVRGAPETHLASARETDLKLVYDASVVDEWDGLKWPDDILGAVNWLAGSLAEHGLCLKQNDLVLTSAWGPPVPVGEHTRVDVTSSSFGSVSATFS